ncbi:MAG: MBL fold metallo-hydrolase [bacterium]
MKALLKLFLLLLAVVNLSFAQNANPTITTAKLSDNLYQFFIYINENNSVNVFASIGQDGIILIDAGFSVTAELVKTELKKLSDKQVKWIINTHYDGDHTLGNAYLGTNASIISHELCRSRLLAYTNFPQGGLPGITFFDSAKIFFNGEEICLKYLPGHTNADIIVSFKNANLVFVGDLVFADSFPLLQPDGNVYSLEKNLTLLSKSLSANTRIFPGHGRELNSKELNTYIEMVTQTKNLALKSIKEGNVPAESKKNKILKEWDKWNSKIFPGQITTDSWIDNLYSSLDEGKEMSAYPILKKTYDQSGCDAMITKYNEICSSKKQYFIETDFNNWGYALLAEQKASDAINVFQINTNEFPASANAFDSLGEAYMIAGNKELAIKNYEKSLELNPNNTNAAEQLKILNK